MDPRDINLEDQHGVKLLHPSDNQWFDVDLPQSDYTDCQVKINEIFKNVVFERSGQNKGYNAEFQQFVVDGVRFACFSYYSDNSDELNWFFHKEENGAFKESCELVEDMETKYEKAFSVAKFVFYICA